ncbi:hypothetical protein V1478_010944 [Vespula squamosa]|uniref:Secreted protein n=1 Tax=Vespula squamosa TaxID=30214 RepID=A0ABD2AGS2_VESSQ
MAHDVLADFAQWRWCSLGGAAAATAELVALPGCACLPATTSFEFLIRKPPCNYWINECPVQTSGCTPRLLVSRTEGTANIVVAFDCHSS